MQKSYTLENVAQVIEADPNDLRDLSKSLGRTHAALNTLRWQAREYQKGNMKAVNSQVLRDNFQKYYNKGDMQLQKKEEAQVETPVEEKVESQPTPEIVSAPASDLCEHELEELVKKASDAFDTLQVHMSEIARVTTKHQLHSTTDELEKLRAWKKEVDPELTDLRSFREAAKKNNFGSMIRRNIPF